MPIRIFVVLPEKSGCPERISGGGSGRGTQS